MQYRNTFTINKTGVDLIKAFLDIDDIEQYTGKLSVFADDKLFVANTTFEDGTKLYVYCCSGQTNYWIDCQIQRTDGAWCDLDPDYDFDDVEFENDGNIYVLHFEIED